MIKKLCSYSCIILALSSIFSIFHGAVPGELYNTAINNIVSLIMDACILEIGMRL